MDVYKPGDPSVCYDYGAAVARQLPWDSFRADQI